jgi:hypothetical protein
MFFGSFPDRPTPRRLNSDARRHGDSSARDAQKRAKIDEGSLQGFMARVGARTRRHGHPSQTS